MTRRAAPALLAPLFALGVAGCPRGGATSETFKPKQFPPTPPGKLVADPPALHLGPGDTAAITVKLLKGDGTTTAPAALTWMSSVPAVASVTSAGSVQAAADGSTEIRVADDKGRSIDLPVVVSDTGADQPFSVRFDSATKLVAVGDNWSPKYTVLDGRGQPINASMNVTLASTQKQVVAVSGSGATAAAQGIAHLFVQMASGPPLVGSQTAVVAEKRVKASGGTLPPCATEMVADCEPNHPPVVFTRPGLTDTLEIGVYREPKCIVSGAGGNGGVEFKYDIEAPTQVKLDVGGVLDMTSDGRIQSAGPGRVTMTEFTDKTACYGSYEVDVGMDLTGDWSGTCKSNGDSLSLSFPDQPSAVMHSQDVAYLGQAPHYTYVPDVGGSSCLSGANGSCSEPAQLTPLFAPGTNFSTDGECEAGGEGACTKAAGCCAFALTGNGGTYEGCGSKHAGTASAIYGGGDTLQIGDCLLHHGGAATCGGAAGPFWQCTTDVGTQTCCCSKQFSDAGTSDNCDQLRCSGKPRCCFLDQDGGTCDCVCRIEPCDQPPQPGGTIAVSDCPPPAGGADAGP